MPSLKPSSPNPNSHKPNFEIDIQWLNPMWHAHRYNLKMIVLLNQILRIKWNNGLSGSIPNIFQNLGSIISYQHWAKLRKKNRNKINLIVLKILKFKSHKWNRDWKWKKVVNWRKVILIRGVGRRKWIKRKVKKLLKSWRRWNCWNLYVFLDQTNNLSSRKSQTGRCSLKVHCYTRVSKRRKIILRYMENIFILRGWLRLRTWENKKLPPR